MFSDMHIVGEGINKKVDLNIDRSWCFTVSIVMTFIFKLTKFRASTLMNICPYKGKLKEGQKNGQNGKIKRCSE